MNCWRCDQPVLDNDSYTANGTATDALKHPEKWQLVGHKACTLRVAEYKLLSMASNYVVRDIVLPYWASSEYDAAEDDAFVSIGLARRPVTLDEVVQWWREHWDLVVRVRQAYNLDAEDGFWDRDPKYHPRRDLTAG